MLFPKKSTLNYDHQRRRNANNNSKVEIGLGVVELITSKCGNCLRRLAQAHAYLIRTHSLISSFHFNLLIRSYTLLHSPSYALRLYLSLSRSVLFPDSHTLPITLKAASSSSPPVFPRQLHSVAIRLGLQSHPHCESSFISSYCKSGAFHDAYKLFDENPLRELASWNAIIAGLSHAARPKDAITMFLDMRKYGFLPDDVTMVAVNSACGSLADFNLALQLHKFVFQAKRNHKRPHHIFLMLNNSLIDMYAKCARMDLANRVFSSMHLKNVSSWTCMIVGYAMHGCSNQAIICFHQMVDEARVTPNYVTFIGVLSACVHDSKVYEGKYYFDSMTRVYGIVPRLQHYGCMVDLLGRAGLLQEAREVIEGMPMKANTVIFGCLMGACQKYGDVKMGEWVAKHLKELEPWNDGVYVVLSNIYASRGLWDQVERVRVIMKWQQLDKIPAYSLTTISN